MTGVLLAVPQLKLAGHSIRTMARPAGGLRDNNYVPVTQFLERSALDLDQGAASAKDND
jgi:hypothetical protein